MEYKVRTRFSGERLFSNSPRHDRVPRATLATRHSGCRAVRAAAPVTSSIRQNLVGFRIPHPGSARYNRRRGIIIPTRMDGEVKRATPDAPVGRAGHCFNQEDENGDRR